MNLYEKQIEKELLRWHKDIVKSAGLLERATGGVQKKTQQLMPRKIQNAITAAVEKMTHTMMFGSGLLTIREDTAGLSLAERDYLVLQCFQGYMKTAVAQGIGFGAGGVLLGLADLPVLMSIKVKFLFDCAKLYGFDPEEQGERLYLLHIFQLAFSSREHRLEVFRTLEGWDAQPPAGEAATDLTGEHAVDWERFQVEYRDYLDLAKLLQLLPVVGSVAGGTANHKLMHRLRENVMNCYRMRITGRRFPAGEQKGAAR